MLFGCSVVHSSPLWRQSVARRFSVFWIFCFLLKLLCLLLPFFLAFCKDGWWYRYLSPVSVSGELSLHAVSVPYFAVGVRSPQGAASAVRGIEFVSGQQPRQIEQKADGGLDAKETNQWTVLTKVSEEEGGGFRVHVQLAAENQNASLPPVDAAELSLSVSGSLGNDDFAAAPKVFLPSLWPSRCLKAKAQLKLLDAPITNSDSSVETQTDFDSKKAALANAALTSPVYVQVFSSQWLEAPAAAAAKFTLEMELEIPKGQRQQGQPSGFDEFLRALLILLVPLCAFLLAGHYLKSALIRLRIFRTQHLPPDPLLNSKP